jgi:hypothetical protein
MTLAGLLARLVKALDDAGIPYMVIGSLASSFHGEPRATMGINLVIHPAPDSLDVFLAQIESSTLYLDADAARDALRTRTQFNVIDPDTGLKGDLVVRKERPFSREELARRQPADLLGEMGYIATAEDTIIAKLEWAKAGESERQLRDVEGILAISGPQLDIGYIDRWAAELGVSELWEHARVEG